MLMRRMAISRLVSDCPGTFQSGPSRLLTAALEADQQRISAHLAERTPTRYAPMHKGRDREDQEPQALPAPAEDQQQDQVAPEVPAHHAEPVDGQQGTRETDDRRGGGHATDDEALVLGHGDGGIDGAERASVEGGIVVAEEIPLRSRREGVRQGERFITPGMGEMPCRAVRADVWYERHLGVARLGNPRDEVSPGDGRIEDFSRGYCECLRASW